MSEDRAGSPVTGTSLWRPGVWRDGSARIESAVEAVGLICQISAPS